MKHNTFNKNHLRKKQTNKQTREKKTEEKKRRIFFLQGARLEGLSKTLKCFTEKNGKRRWTLREQTKAANQKYTNRF